MTNQCLAHNFIVIYRFDIFSSDKNHGIDSSRPELMKREGKLCQLF